MSANFKMSFMTLSTNFDIEPVLADYVKTYPEQADTNYRIVFKTENEFVEGSKSYIIVYDYSYLRHNKNSPHWGEFLQSHCILNNLVAVIGTSGHVFPNISDKDRHGTHYGKLGDSQT
ncbi:MAG: hypothetical protein SFZ02_18905 [bacterium]|nr:hypothetical protein [bacterium]